MLKRIVMIFIFILLLSSCGNSNLALEIKEVKIASSITNQIQSIDDFRLDKIVLDVNYENNKNQHMVLTQDMLKPFDKKVGYQELQMKQYDFSIPLIIYDKFFLEENYIYYYDNNIYYGENIYQISTPKKEGLFFGGWYSDYECEIKYMDKEEKIIQIYPKFSKYEMFKVDFYLDDKIIDRQYVLSGHRYDEVYVEGDFDFKRWHPAVVGVFSDLRLDALVTRQDECLIDFYDGDKIIDYKIVKKGSSVTVNNPVKDGHTFLSWSCDLDNIAEDMNVYAEFKKNDKYYKVYFKDEKGAILEIDYVLEGEPAQFDYYNEKYNYLGFSTDFESVYTDLTIIVYRVPKVYRYYIGDDLYRVANSLEEVSVPKLNNGYLGWWKKDGEDIFKLEHVRSGSVFNLHLEGDPKVYRVTREELFEGIYGSSLVASYSYIMMLKKRCVAYEWYYDSQYTEFAGELSEDSGYDTVEVTLYGKEVQLSERISRSFLSELMCGLNEEDWIVYAYAGNPTNAVCHIDGGISLNDYIPAVSGIDESIFRYYSFVSIGPNVDKIKNLENFNKDRALVQYIMVHPDNPYFKSSNGDLYDKITNELIIDVEVSE